MLLTDYISYFENLAVRHKRINHTQEEKHFAVLSVDEIITRAKSGLDFKTPCLILQVYDVQFSQVNSDQINYQMRGSLMVIQHHSIRHDAVSERKTKLQDCERIFLDILSAMKRDKSECNLMKNFSLKTTKSFTVHNLYDNCHGWKIDFDLENPIDLNYKAENWNA